LLGKPYSVRLAFAYVRPLVFGNERQHLQDNVRNEFIDKRIGESAFSYCSRLTSISFNGTMAQWNAIEKNDYWNVDTGNYTIHCTDGDIAKDN